MKHESLTSQELEKIASILSHFQDSMDIESIDGLFTSLICGPQIISMDKCLPDIMGANFKIESMDQRNSLMKLFQNQWNFIGYTLYSGLEFYPLLRGVKENEAGNWAKGFIMGITFNHQGWHLLFNDKKSANLLRPILDLVSEAGNTNSQPFINQEKHKESAYLISVCVKGIYRYFEPARLKI